MHPIPVRKMEFDIPTAADFNPKWAANNILMSYMTTGVSLYVAYLEPFLVKSLRRVLDVAVAPMFVKTYMPWYSPHKLVVPDNIEQLSKELTAAAKSAT